MAKTDLKKKPIRLVSTASHIYEGRQLRPNDKFEAKDETDAADLIAIHYAKRDTSVEPMRYERRDMRVKED